VDCDWIEAMEEGGGGQVAVLGILPPGKFVRFITPKASRFEQAESKDFNGF
jgi:hypothetical protein